MKFRIGDEVIVFRKCNSYENNWADEWIDEMDIFINKVCIVNSISINGFQLKYNNRYFNFPEFVIEKYRLNKLNRLLDEE